MNYCCCECPLNLGCLQTCSLIDMGFVATLAGKYTLKYKFNGAWLSVDSEILAVDDPIIFDISELVPDYQYQALIVGPDGEFIDLTKDVIEYDCLRFTPILTLNHQ